MYTNVWIYIYYIDSLHVKYNLFVQTFPFPSIEAEQSGAAGLLRPFRQPSAGGATVESEPPVAVDHLTSCDTVDGKKSCTT